MMNRMSNPHSYTYYESSNNPHETIPGWDR